MPTVLSDAFLSSPAGGQRLVLVVLNWSLPHTTREFWGKAQLRICADGGANRLYDAAPRWAPHAPPAEARAAFMPHIIKGDLDSIRPEVARFYEQRGTRIVDLGHDQDSTDLQKCLACAEHQLGKQGQALDDTTILAVGAMGGRLDHTLSNVNALYTHSHLRLVLCGEGVLARLVPAGRSVIEAGRSWQGPSCGLIALGKPAVASSKGLKWDLDKHRLEVGGLMSTSNILEADAVEVETDTPLLWTTEFRDVPPE